MSYTEIIYKDGTRRRKYKDGTIFWCDKQGKYHRGNNKPACIYPDGTKIWYKHGNQHGYKVE